jgi:hypothetical protein
MQTDSLFPSWKVREVSPNANVPARSFGQMLKMAGGGRFNVRKGGLWKTSAFTDGLAVKRREGHVSPISTRPTHGPISRHCWTMIGTHCAVDFH